ncbi:hypothetical protein [Nocardia lijiangensis]
MTEDLSITQLTGPEYLTTHLRWLDTYPVTARPVHSSSSRPNG